MAKRHELDARVLTVFLLVALPFVAFGSFLFVSLAKARLEDSIGDSLEQRALQTKLSLERYVGDVIVGLHQVSLDPDVLKAVASQPKPGVAVAESPLSARLREVAQVRPALLLIQVINAQGNVVAATSGRGRTSAPDSRWFQKLLGEDATLRPFVGDIQRTPGGSGVATLEVAYPIRALQGPAIGVVRALVDAADLYGVLSSVRIGRTGHAVLVRAEDGLVLASDDTERVLRDRFPGYESIRAAMREKRGSWLVPEVEARTEAGKTTPGEPARLVGYAPVEQVPDVNWVVTVEQDASEATEPLTGVTRYLWTHFAFVLAAVALLALYFSFKLEAPVIEEGLHLHEAHVPTGVKTS